MMDVLGVSVEAVDEVCGADWEALVLVTGEGLVPPQALEDFVTAHYDFDPASKQRGGVCVVRCARVCGARLVLASTGPLTPYDDVRSVSEAMRAGVSRAVRAGVKRVVVCVQPHARFPRAPLVALLAALEALYVPLQVYGEGVTRPVHDLIREAVALERGRVVARDIGGGDPERMSALRCAEYITSALPAECGVSVRVLTDHHEIRRQYPLLAAVTRAADQVDRHRGCVVFLEFEPAEYDRTLMFVGKGVTYDTGGADVKVGGAMVGMSRDKCGAANIAGFFKTLSELKDVARVKAVAALGFARNSIGEESYVADEIIANRGGVPVRVGNTDAEGRMVMADLLHEMRERALSEKSPHVYTVATLTGHAVRTAGEGYSIAMDNHAARTTGHAHKLQALGDQLGDMFEVSVIRREDLATHRGRAPGEAIFQALPAPSSQTPRGHQGPAAFLLLASELHRGDVRYTHIDIAAAAAAGEPPAPPTAAPLLALAAAAGLIAA